MATIKVLKLGSKSPDVRILQERLIEWKMLSAPADSIFGPLTLEAVKNLQRAKGLVADGIVGPKTAAALELGITPISDAEFKNINDKVALKGPDFLDDREVEMLAQRLNVMIDVPIIPESLEHLALAKAVRLIDRALMALLPDEFYTSVRDTGLAVVFNPDEYKPRIVKALNKTINIPWLSEDSEEKVFNFIVGLFLDSARNNNSLQELIASS